MQSQLCHTASSVEQLCHPTCGAKPAVLPSVQCTTSCASWCVVQSQLCCPVFSAEPAVLPNVWVRASCAAQPRSSCATQCPVQSHQCHLPARAHPEHLHCGLIVGQRVMGTPRGSHPGGHHPASAVSLAFCSVPISHHESSACHKATRKHPNAGTCVMSVTQGVPRQAAIRLKPHKKIGYLN